MIIRKVILNYFTILTKVKLYVNVNTRKVHEKYIFLCIWSSWYVYIFKIDLSIKSSQCLKQV